MRIRSLLVALVVLAAASCGGEEAGSSAQPTQGPTTPSMEPSADPTKAPRPPRIADGSLQVSAVVLTFRSPSKALAGKTKITLKNTAPFSHEVRLIRLGAKDDLTKIAEMDRPDALKAIDQIGAIRRVFQGETSKPLVLNLETGRYGLICFLGFPDDTHANRGMFKELKVIKKK